MKGMTEEIDAKEFVRIMKDTMANIKPTTESVSDFISKSNINQQEIDSRINKILEKL